MNEWPELGCGEEAMSDRNWVGVTVRRGGCYRSAAGIYIRSMALTFAIYRG